MEFYITNEDRHYLGLPTIEEHWKIRTLNNGEVIFVDKNKIVKLISQKDNYYYERTHNEELSEDGIWLLPKTTRGKKKKLSSSTIMNKTPLGTYFSWRDGHIRIGNFTTQKTFYSTYHINNEVNNLNDFYEWLKEWKEETTEELRESLNAFSTEKRKRVAFKEGDIFSIKYDRNSYGFGRVLLDVRRIRKEGKEPFHTYMGNPILIKQYVYKSKTRDIDLDVLEKCLSFPSVYIMDNVLLYDDYSVIGHKELTNKDLDYPILYRKSIDARDLNKIRLNIGPLYLQIPKDTNPYYGEYGTSGIGFNTNVDLEMLDACITQKSLKPYWTSTSYRYQSDKDLRNPINKRKRVVILKQFGIKDYYLHKDFRK